MVVKSFVVSCDNEIVRRFCCELVLLAKDARCFARAKVEVATKPTTIKRHRGGKPASDKEKHKIPLRRTTELPIPLLFLSKSYYLMSATFGNHHPYGGVTTVLRDGAEGGGTGDR